MEILEKPVGIEHIKQLANNIYGDMIKAVVDVDLCVLAVDAELHSDLESLLLKNGSEQSSLWGINIYPDATEDEFIEFDSLINIRPRQNNRSRDVEDQSVREKILAIVSHLVK